MHYYIDGYNLLFHLQNSGDLQSRREAIIRDLGKKITFLNLKASIVFDAPFQLGEGTRGYFNDLEILFTAEGETADEYIIEEIKNSHQPQLETVVTSDKELAHRVLIRYARAESVEEFYHWLNRSYKNKLRRSKQTRSGTEHPFAPPPAATIPKTSPHLKDPKDSSAEAVVDYYQQVFDERWKEILKEEEERKRISAATDLERRKRAPRKPKSKKDPFKKMEKAEEKAETEMERWLKIFERNTE